MKNKPSEKVLVTASYLYANTGPYYRALEARGFSPVFPSKPPLTVADTDWPRELAGFRYVIAGTEKYTPELLAALPMLRVISRAGVGIDTVDLPACTARGVIVAYVPGGNATAVAEHTLALILALAKKIPEYDALVRGGNWTRSPVLSLRGKTLGIFGYGRIGREVARLAAPFQMECLTTRSLEELLRRSDFLSVHAPLNETTRGTLNYEKLSLMKPTAYLINTARGPIVPVADLVRALEAKRLAGAALDVFDKEPLGQSELARFPNVILSPHIAGVDDRSLEDLSLGAVENLFGVLSGQAPEGHVLNPAAALRP